MITWADIAIAIAIGVPLGLALEGLRWAVWRFHEWRCDVYYARHVQPEVDRWRERETSHDVRPD